MSLPISAPLAERMRPRTLDEFFGQDELVGPSSFLRRAITEDRAPSMILWGPPGSGKTTLARIIAAQTRAEFVPLSATSSGLKELRATLDHALSGHRLGIRTVCFVDEIHRWNKAQQDVLLPEVERGVVTFIGATTENPSFEVNAALLSRCRVFVLQRLSEDAITKIVQNAITDAERGLGQCKISIERGPLALLARQANGDARTALNVLEACAEESREISGELIKKILQKTSLQYDKNGDEHYNIISALHKSMRGGDARAAVYWLARMLEAGEDPLYVARRLARFAAEDVGLANPTALLLTNAVFEACHKIGMPECGVHLSEAVIYLAKSPKSIFVYQAYERAKRDVAEFGNLPVPLHLRNAPTALMRELKYGRDYRYTPLENSDEQTYLPPELQGLSTGGANDAVVK